ncbi:MAG: Protein translocase subunit SecA, partial [Candidatus Collierbacteria bacterium GW2011_GWB1_44_35]
MLNFINTLFNPNKVEIGKLQKIVDQINLLEEKVKKLKDDAFPAEIAQYKEELKRG